MRAAIRTVLPAAFLLCAEPALAQTDPHAGHGSAEQTQSHSAQSAAPANQTGHSTHGEHQEHSMHGEHRQHGMHHQHDAQHDDHSSMTGVLGAYPMSREASGTSWQPDVSEHGGVHATAGGWTLMSHAMLNGVYDWQDGPRGDEKAFVSGMIMGAARRDFASGTLNLRAMLSPDPAMGAEGYPLLFAAGETADGVETLIDRQHPHDFFMELSASYAHRLSAQDSIFVYAGLPGEPAFGPPNFMHRLSAMDSPEAPISHHWLDSGHITFGVLTVGYIHDNWKFEASRFRGREPDEHRWDIETGALDSTALRVSWNPNRNWALQASWADIESPEALEPDVDETRWSASALYTAPIFDGWWSTTFAFANKESSEGASRAAWLAEAALHPNAAWTLFARAEAIETDELTGDHGAVENVQRISVGAIRDWRLGEHAVLGLGALAQQHFTSDALEPLYDGDPQGAMAFVRLKIG